MSAASATSLPSASDTPARLGSSTERAATATPPPLPELPPLAVVALPNTGSPILALRLVFRAGSVDDPAGREGLTALTARLLCEGGTASRTAAEFTRALYPMAAELRCDTDKEFTTIAARVHRERAGAFVPLLVEALSAPRFDAKEFERLRAEQLTAIRARLRNENDEELGKVMLDALLFEGHPYRHAVVGTTAGLTATTLDDARTHWRRVFTQDRLVIGTAGGATSDDASALVERLKALPQTGGPRVTIPLPGPRSLETLVVRRATASTAGSFGFASPLRRDHPDFPALFLGLSYLGEHRQEHGVFFRELRDRRGLNYGTYAYAEHYRQDGWEALPRPNVRRTVEDVSFWLRPVEPANGPFATRALLALLDEALREPLPAARFETARGFLLGALRQWTLTDQRRLGWAIDERLTGTPGYVERLRSRLTSLTSAEVQRVLLAHLRPQRLSFVFVTRDADALAAALSSGAPTPPTYPSPRSTDVLEADARLERFPLPMRRQQTVIIDAAQVMER
ncbi:MAG: insulinase family protein [Myxococcaceae bacterium]|jgi:zinc protease|nr:insulinase family protein [Myxococcaceae bacterium]MCA3013552.1 insulinase family protein [Myxococcaceae bacterium]